jgi:hypothetical protein
MFKKIPNTKIHYNIKEHANVSNVTKFGFEILSKYNPS